MKSIIVAVAVAVVGSLMPAGAKPCRPNDGACQPKACKINATVGEDGTITLGSPVIECYY